jgi:hypothetical protein
MRTTLTSRLGRISISAGGGRPAPRVVPRSGTLFSHCATAPSQPGRAKVCLSRRPGGHLLSRLFLALATQESAPLEKRTRRRRHLSRQPHCCACSACDKARWPRHRPEINRRNSSPLEALPSLSSPLPFAFSFASPARSAVRHCVCMCCWGGLGRRGRPAELDRRDGDCEEPKTVYRALFFCVCIARPATLLALHYTNSAATGADDDDHDDHDNNKSEIYISPARLSRRAAFVIWITINSARKRSRPALWRPAVEAAALVWQVARCGRASRACLARLAGRAAPQARTRDAIFCFP